MLRRTKIIATLGPSTDSSETLEKIINAGVDVVRLNFSHGEAEDHKARAARVREAAAKLGRYVAIMGDLQGPKIRIDRFKSGKVKLKNGDKFILDAGLDPNAGDENAVGLTYKQLPKDVKRDDILLLDDGLIKLKVKEVDGLKIHCKVLLGGTLSNNKGINRLGGGLSAAALTHKDRIDIGTAAEMQVDYVAVSFPRSASDIQEARKLLQAAGSQAGIVAKIERAEALTAMEEIIQASDAIMVARGDLGVEIGDAALPSAQKQLIRTAIKMNKVAITATQMMQSMIDNPIPTRAEVSDVANAVFDGTDAVMLSGETAVGKYPTETVEAMVRVCMAAEGQPISRKSDHRMEMVFGRIDEAIAMSTMYAANHMNAKAIAALTESGSTPLWMSRINSDIPIYAISHHHGACARMALYRGVMPILLEGVKTQDATETNQAIMNELLKHGAVSSGDLVIVTKGDKTGLSGGTNTMKILCVNGVK